MQITGVTPDQFAQIVAVISDDKYQGNLEAQITSVQSATRFRARIVPKHSSIAPKTPAPGARLSGNYLSGQRCIKAACWHAFRDVLAYLFLLHPEARVYTAMAKYKGRKGFLDNYLPTRNQNIGSMAYPVTMPELCDCEY